MEFCNHVISSTLASPTGDHYVLAGYEEEENVENFL